jgi:hypothetical protein
MMVADFAVLTVRMISTYAPGRRPLPPDTTVVVGPAEAHSQSLEAWSGGGAAQMPEVQLTAVDAVEVTIVIDL